MKNFMVSERSQLSTLWTCSLVVIPMKRAGLSVSLTSSILETFDRAYFEAPTATIGTIFNFGLRARGFDIY